MARHKSEILNQIHDYGLLVSTRTIYLDNVVDFKCADSFLKNLHYLESLNSEPISIVMNNIGGEEFDGLAIYDAIQLSPAEITIKVFGSAMSMGAVILQAADKRLMSKHSKLMIHYGTACISGENHAKISYKWIEESRKFDNLMREIFLEKIKQKLPDYKVNKLDSILDFDTILCYTEALNLNLIDGIIE